jgi:hypothetical protein
LTPLIVLFFCLFEICVADGIFRILSFFLGPHHHHIGKLLFLMGCSVGYNADPRDEAATIPLLDHLKTWFEVNLAKMIDGYVGWDAAHVAVGARVDVQDTTGCWYPAVVRTRKDHNIVKAHFRGWGSIWDVNIDVNKEINRIAPPGTITIDKWALRQLYVTQMVHLKLPTFARFTATVYRISPEWVEFLVAVKDPMYFNVENSVIGATITYWERPTIVQKINGIGAVDLLLTLAGNEDVLCTNLFRMV